MADDTREKYINPYTDFGFKKLFGTEMNKDLLISFLNALFMGHQNIKDVKYLPTEHFGVYGDSLVPSLRQVAGRDFYHRAGLVAFKRQQLFGLPRHSDRGAGSRANRSEQYDKRQFVHAAIISHRRGKTSSPEWSLRTRERTFDIRRPGA